jgi:hypothetical protein
MAAVHAILSNKEATARESKAPAQVSQKEHAGEPTVPVQA